MKILFGNSLWQLIVMSDGVSKLVMLSLLGMSIACWTVFLYKFILLRLKKRQLYSALHSIRKVNTLQELLNLSSAFASTMPGYFLSHNLSFLKTQLTSQEKEGQALAADEWNDVQEHAYEIFDDIIHYEQQYMPVLHSSAGVSTLMGLFGTVWGLVHAFIRISEKQSADITTVAPGIAEALITTLAGLIVAVPAFLMYFYLENEIKNMEFHLGKFVDRYTNIVKKIFIEKGKDYEKDSATTGTFEKTVELGR